MTTSRPFAGSQTNFNYGYGDLDRLVQATRPISGDPDETFIYDPVGNRLQRDGDIVDNIFDDANRLLEDADFTYTYDDNGNTVSKTDKVTSEVTEYGYDPENSLISFVDV